MTEHSPEAVQVAKLLSAAQRVVVLYAEPDGHLGIHFVHWWHANGRTLRSLRRKGIGSVVWSGIALTPLGLEVRAVLMEMDDATRK